MSSENISNWKYQNTQRSRDMLAEYLSQTKGIADAGAVAHLIADNERRGYLNHAAKIGATFGSVADVLAMQLDGSTPIEDDGPISDRARDCVRSAISGLADLPPIETGEAILAAFTATNSAEKDVNVLDALVEVSSRIADAIDGIEDAIRDGFRSVAPPDSTYEFHNVVDATMISGRAIADAIREHAAAIDRLAASVEKATDRPIRVETQY